MSFDVFRVAPGGGMILGILFWDLVLERVEKR